MSAGELRIRVQIEVPFVTPLGPPTTGAPVGPAKTGQASGAKAGAPSAPTIDREA